MSGSDAAVRLRNDAAALMRDELDSLRGELADTARHMSSGAIMATASAGTGLLALAALHATLLRLLESVMPPWAAAAVLAGGYVAAAAVLVFMARKQLKAAADSASAGRSERGSGDSGSGDRESAESDGKVPA
jgi:hypothetical protein